MTAGGESDEYRPDWTSVADVFKRMRALVFLAPGAIHLEEMWDGNYTEES
jgi:hypothetical protein